MEKSKAFSLVEMVVVLGIVMLMGSIASVYLQNRLEKNSYIEVKSKIPEFFELLAMKGNDLAEESIIDIDFESNYIKAIYTNGEYEMLNLPTNLNYAHIDSSDKIVKKLSRKIGETGNLNISFTIYVFNKKNEAIYKIVFDNGTEFVRHLKSTEYIPVEKIKIEEVSNLKNSNKYWKKI